MTGLITRLQNATEPDRELDARIWCGLKGHFGYIEFDEEWIKYSVSGFGFTDFFRDIPNYTSSIDAALTLIPKRTRIELVIAMSSIPSTVFVSNSKGTGYGEHKTPAIAICIAALKAIEHETKEQANEHD